MPSFLERIRVPREPTQNKKTIESVLPTGTNYDMQSGHAYVLLGGVNEDVKTNCVNCGAPFKGPCQPSCEFCSSQRKTYYADITNVNFLSAQNDAPIDALPLVLPEGDTLEFGHFAELDMVVAEEIKTQNSFSAGLVITRKFTTGHFAEIGTLVIIDDGSATFGNNAEIGTLMTGKNVHLKFGGYSEIYRLLKTSKLDCKADVGFVIDKTKIINKAEFIDTIAKALKK